LMGRTAPAPASGFEALARGLTLRRAEVFTGFGSRCLSRVLSLSSVSAKLVWIRRVS